MKVKELQWKKVLRIALLVLLPCLAGMTKMYAYDFSAVCETGQTLYYNIIDATNHYVELTCPGSSGWDWSGYTQPTGNIVLPENVQYNGATYIVTSIGNYAFRSCNSLSGSLTIPNSVTSIGNYAFYGCSGFTGSLTIGNSVTRIGRGAFQNCSGFIGNLTIPNSVTTIDGYAFYSCNGFNGILTIGNSISAIGTLAFYYCIGFVELVYNATNCPDLATSGPFSWFSGSLVIGENVQRIPAWIFCGGNFVGSLVIPNSVTEIGTSAFQGSPFTGNLVIPNSVTSIGWGAFYNCTGFNGCLTIGNSVTMIDNKAFYNCIGFTSISSLAETPPFLDGTDVFFNVNTNIPVIVPCGSIGVYQNASGWSGFTNIQESCSQQTVTFSAGWNWFSANLEITLEDLKAALMDALGSTTITITSQSDGSTIYNGSTWRGTLNAMDVTQMYMIQTTAACEITLSGTPINPAGHSIAIHNGNNWIAFQLGENMTLSNAFSGFAVNGDMVISQFGSATYNGNNWRGALNTLAPGQGYMYKSNVQGDRTFTFPTIGK